MAKYIDADILRKEIKRLKDEYTDIAIDSRRGWINVNFIIDDLEQLQSKIDFLQQELDVIDLSFKGGTYRINGVEKPFNAGTAKLAILEIKEAKK